MPRRLALTAVLTAALLGLVGWGAARVASSDVAGAVADQVEGQIGARPDVDCPDDLEATVGATARCTLTVAGVDGEYGVTVTVTGIEDEQASFDIEVDQEPQG